MINEQDFDVAASDICDRVVMIADPRLVVTIEKWLSKLTSSENRGANELNYLKLLQYMVANKRIGRPFVREPPLGPLLPLSRYINPPPCSRLLVRRKSGAETGWRTVSCTRAAQTVERDYDDSDDSVDYYGGEGVENRNYNGHRDGALNANGGGGGGASQSKNGGGGGASQSKNGGSGASGSKNEGNGLSQSKNGGSGALVLKNGGSGALQSKNFGSGASVLKNGGSGSLQSKNSGRDKDADVDNDHRVNASREQKTDDANGMKETTFDGHLAGGECDSNWGPTKCGGGERNPVKNIDQMAKLCNPCLDNLGWYKKHLHGPMDATYRDLLGDCAFPVFTETERNSVSSELLDILNNVDDGTTLQEFYCQVSLYTCDQGELLMRMSNGMLDDFREFVTDVFESRAEHISDGLAKEQMLMNDKYTYLEHRMLNRATVALDFLREAMPVFSWYKYRDGVDVYLKRLISLWQTHSAAAAATSGDADDVAAGGVAAGGAGDDEDETNVQRSTTLKKLLYTLNRQRSDVTRAECEGKRLYEQRNGLLTALAESNAKLSAVQCQSAADVDRLKDELALLQRQTADQTIAVDKLMETTQLVMQNKKHSLSPSTSCR